MTMITIIIPLLFSLCAHCLVPLESSASFRQLSTVGRALGDISFTLPPDFAVNVKAFLAEDKTCPILGSGKSKQKRVPDDIVGCLVADAEDILDNMSIGDTLAAPFDNAQPGGAIQFPPEIDTSWMTTMGLIAFHITYFFVFITAQTLTHILIRGPQLDSQFTNCIVGWKPQCNGALFVGVEDKCTANAYFRGCPCDPNPCPKPYEHSLLCSMDCGGADSTGKCLGTVDGDWKGCDCVEPTGFPFFNALEHDFKDISRILAALPDAIPVNDTPTTACNEKTGNAWTYGSAAEIYVKMFCPNSTNLVGQKSTQTQQQYGVASLDEDLTIKATLTDPAGSENVVVSEGDCFANL
ncbi:hypothetical protein BKA65DRAFT_536306 [Rhexocercosporidium sp. MPI-PUGE-AT-0058]|nr:hypothetical protein BKA65DRAFT_536306 [Rhexocercosporidium sp. MPI-PUGE-AT-0058]